MVSLIRGKPPLRAPRLRAAGEVKHCQADLPEQPGPNDPPPDRHQVSNLPEKLYEVTGHQSHGCRCPRCGKVTRAELPREVGGSCFGGRLVALRRFMTGACHARRRNAQETATHILEIPISLGTVRNLEAEVDLDIVPAVFDRWNSFRSGFITRETLQALLAPYRNQLRASLAVGIRCAERKTATMCENLLLLEPALWTFVFEAGVEPTNNHAERLFRSGVLWRKRSLGTQSERGCRYVERCLTTVQMPPVQSRSVFSSLAEAVATHRRGAPAPFLVLAYGGLEGRL